MKHIPKFIDKYGYGGAYEYIHPYKQKDVKTVEKEIKDDVEAIIVFGSSIKDTCRPNSDIDMCIIGNIKNINISKNIEVDILSYPSVSILKEVAQNPWYSIEKEIWNKGVVIYAR